MVEFWLCISPALISFSEFSSPVSIGAGFSSLETWSCTRTFPFLNVIALTYSWNLPSCCLVRIPVVDLTIGWKFDLSAPIGYELQLLGSLIGH